MRPDGSMGAKPTAQVGAVPTARTGRVAGRVHRTAALGLRGKRPRLKGQLLGCLGEARGELDRL